MASMSTGNESKNVLDNLCVHLGSLILKEEQNLVVVSIVKRCYNCATDRLWKSIIFQSFVSLQNFGNASILVQRTISAYN